MPIFGPLIGAGVSLASALMGAGAQQDATNLGYANLYEQRRRSRQQEREQRRVNALAEQLQKATRTDALGNAVRFDEGLNSFVTETTPLTQATLDSQQNELLRSLREDAPRNRAAAERQDRRSRLGDEQFERVFNEYRYRPQQNEAASISDATNELLSARRKGLTQAQGDITRQLLRTGGSSNIGAVSAGIGDQYADSLADAVLEGKRIGSQRFRERSGDDVARFMNELQGLRSIADDTTTSPVGQSNANEMLTGRADQALQQLIAAITGGGDRLNNVMSEGAGRESQAMQSLANMVSRGGLDLSGVASSLSGLSMPQKADPLDRQIKEAQLANILSQIAKRGGNTQMDPSQSTYDPWAGLRDVTF